MKSITKTALERCRSYLVESEKSAATAEKYMRDLRAFAAWIKGAELCRILRRYAAERNITEGSIFISRKGTPVNRSTILRMFKKLCGEAGVERQKVFPHNLRHLFARTFYAAQKDIVRLADILGHSNINTTRIYTMESGEIFRSTLTNLGLLRC